MNRRGVDTSYGVNYYNVSQKFVAIPPHPRPSPSMEREIQKIWIFENGYTPLAGLTIFSNKTFSKLMKTRGM